MMVSSNIERSIFGLKKLGSSLISTAPTLAKEPHRKATIEALNRWGASVFDLNVTLRKEPTLEFFWQNHYELQYAVFENLCVPLDIVIRALVDMPTVEDVGNKGSEQIQRLIGEQTSQHGVIDLLVEMNTDLDDFMDCLNSDLSNMATVSSKEGDPKVQQAENVDFRKTAALGFVRSSAYATLVANDVKSGDVTNRRVKKVLDIVGEAALLDHFCLQQACFILKEVSSKHIANWLVGLQEAKPMLQVRLWRQQDPKLLAEVASKYAAFFKAYLQFLVQALKKGEHMLKIEYDMSPTWYSSFTKALKLTDNYRLRIRTLRDVPRLETPTRVYLSDQGVVI